MKKTILTIALIIFTTTQSFAHYLWIETDPNGQIGTEQNIKVFFGEYTYGVIEKVEGEAFPNVKDFTLWVVDEKGNKVKLETTAFEDHYLAKFTPSANGTYTVVLNNDHIDVIDYTKYDFGIFKTHYHSVTKIQVGNAINKTIALNEKGITVKDISTNKDEIKLQVLFKNKPLAKNELKVFVADLWSKTLETDDNGIVSFKLPWKTKYIVETTFSEKVPGVYKGDKYEFIWHCVTYSII
ncbi:DUF4198 domain-containing protein [Mariniflexile litorale]|uniref:DUF4198 domain-containing protein n=1 Tax=Mariniflexile litorale TaxID=3045158 RepID=A0AAU7ECS0_9FLAO|nr:DUF4198 domain-containing protein [Mariniflexile sp. KMM 9835]MDQ8210422.1 DUF4198 domain-containing protein [Mariniflexile sp. KMM 9835]